MVIKSISLNKLYNNSGQVKGLSTNPRQISEADFLKLKKSIQDNPEMLELRELIVYPQDDYFIVIAGNMRLRAMKELEFTYATCKVLDKNTSLEKLKAYTIKDNISRGEWDFELLANDWEVDELIEFGLDLPVDFGAFENEDKLDNENEDNIPEVLHEPKTKMGDVWILGKHRLMCEDSTNVNNVDKLMNNNKADMVFTDPPYRMETNGGGFIMQTGFKKTINSIEHLCDFNPDDFLNVLPTIFNNIMNAYVFCNKDLIPDYLSWCLKNNFTFNILIWKKEGVIPLGNTHRPDLEYLLHFRKSAIWNSGLKNVNYSKCLEYNKFSYKQKQNEAGGHPTPKPVEMVENEILISSNKNSIVVDLFGGSGTTLIACEKTKRINYSMELDPHYCDVIIKRWQDYTKKDAILETTQEKFNNL